MPAPGTGVSPERLRRIHCATGIAEVPAAAAGVSLRGGRRSAKVTKMLSAALVCRLSHCSKWAECARTSVRRHPGNALPHLAQRCGDLRRQARPLIGPEAPCQPSPERVLLANLVVRRRDFLHHSFARGRRARKPR